MLAARGPSGFVETAAAARSDVASGALAFRDLAGRLDLKLDLAAMTPFAHWVTPSTLPKRFDTRFYLLTAPEDQIAACDGCETVDAEWIGPAEALALGRAGERILLLPTRLNLGLLTESRDVADAIRLAATRPVVPIHPTVGKDAEGRRVVTIPADAGYGDVGPQQP